MSAPKTKTVKDTSERWLLTYSDLMNLLLILFIILFAMSQLDIAKFNQLAGSLREVLGDSTAASVMGTGGSSNVFIDMEGGSASPVIPADLEKQQMEKVREEVEAIIKNSGLGNQVIVTMEERGVVITIQDSLLFKSGSADIETHAKKTKLDIGKILSTMPANQIRVEGHTDDYPINTSRFPSNWELSSARAINVLHLLVDNTKIHPGNILAIGYGEYSPKVPNTTPENKSKNRRVNIVIIKNHYSSAQSETSISNLNAAVNNTSAQ